MCDVTGDDDDEMKLKNVRIEIVFAGGVALVYVSQPLDTVKVKMQTFPHIYKGMVNCLTVTFKKDGIIRGLYAGTTPAIVANVAENSVLFAGNYDQNVCHPAQIVMYSIFV